MKRAIKICILSFSFLILVMPFRMIEASETNDRVISSIGDFLVDYSSENYGVVSSETKTFVIDGITYDLTTEIIKEEFLSLDEIIENKLRGNGFWTGCYATPGTYTIKSTLDVKLTPLSGKLVANTRFNLTNSSIAIESLNIGGTSSSTSTVKATTKKVHSTLAQFNYTMSYPGNSLYSPTTKNFTIETEIAKNTSSGGLMYRYKTDFYY